MRGAHPRGKTDGALKVAPVAVKAKVVSRLRAGSSLPRSAAMLIVDSESR